MANTIPSATELFSAIISQEVVGPQPHLSDTGETAGRKNQIHKTHYLPIWTYISAIGLCAFLVRVYSNTRHITI